jgi:hypothetical protein
LNQQTATANCEQPALPKVWEPALRGGLYLELRQESPLAESTPTPGAAPTTDVPFPIPVGITDVELIVPR